MNPPAGAIRPDAIELSRASARYESNALILRDKYDRTRILLNWVGARKRVLEVGCSTGYISRLLVDHGCDVVGVEVDAAAAERARAHCRNVVVADLNSSDWTSGLAGQLFDVVLLADVLEHLVEPTRVLREVAPFLEPDGRVLISLPNIVHWMTRAKIACGRFDYTSTGTLDHTHLRFFTVKTARELIRSAGYRTIQFHASIGGRLNGHLRPVWQGLARLAPGIFAFQMLFEAKRAGPEIG